MNCPASVRATEGLPDTDSEYSLEGSAAHSLAEVCRKLNAPAAGYIDEEFGQRRADGTISLVKVTREMATAVQEFIDYVNSLDGEDLNESKVSYEQYVPGGFGTLDAAKLLPGLGVIIDLKFGKGVQKFARMNEQLMLYALSVYVAWNWLYDFDRFKLVVHQPRLDHVDEWEIGVTELLVWAKNVVVPAYKRTLDPDAPFNPGAWCMFCKIKGSCRARMEFAITSVVSKFDDISEAVTRIEPAAARAATLSNDEVALLLPYVPNVKAWCKALESLAVRELAEGRKVGDNKLVEGRSNRTWAGSEMMTFKTLSEAAEVPDALWEKKLISPAAAEKLIGKRHEIWKTPGLIDKPKGKPTLAPGSDPRKAMVIDPTAGFNVLEDD